VNSIFGLWAEHSNIEDTRRFAEHFQGLTYTLLSGHIIHWETQVFQPPVDSLGVLVSSNDLSRRGVRTLQDAIESTEAGLRLYHELKTAPAFRFARVAWDPESPGIDDLPEYVQLQPNDERILGLICVMDDDLYRKLGSPIFCEQVTKGYWWRLFYTGEIYKPLHSADQPELNQIVRQLFPERFHV